MLLPLHVSSFLFNLACQFKRMSTLVIFMQLNLDYLCFFMKVVNVITSRHMFL